MDDPLNLILGFLFLCLIIIIIVRLGKHVSSQVDKERGASAPPAAAGGVALHAAGFCTKCGNGYSVGDAFCRKCGAKI